MEKATIIIGPYASGKTTLAHKLASEMYKPVIMDENVFDPNLINGILVNNNLKKKLIITSLLKKDQLPKEILSNCKVIECKRKNDYFSHYVIA